MRVTVVPRTYFEQMRGTRLEKECFASSNIISINAPSASELPPFSPEFLDSPNLLCLYFDDANNPERENNRVFMSRRDCRAIIDFVEHIDRSRPLMIHCTAGISRSGAVGEMLDWFVNCCLEKNHHEHTMFQRRHPALVPNRWVRRILREELEHYNQAMLQTT